ncbi:alpha/beta hydrolase [uncultured Bacteroides sp.]|uniref:alpha/beta hydrolase n=1 Tax=uncultured Bacteroides sp. TaxID=162156 RepID=UPI002AABC4B4|nr:alpha/beta hydrolase [uncultured Bacteroides sp.]
MNRRRVTKVVRYVLLALLTILLGGITWGSFYMLDYSLTSNHNGKDETESYKYMYDNYPYLHQWVDSLNQASALKDTFIIGNENKKLHAYYIAANHPTRKTAVLIHGYTDNAIRMLMIGHLYNHEMNYNILLPDLQAHGRSEGDVIQMGWKDRLDIIKWINVAKAIYGDSINIVVHGISMGAATTMMVSGETLPANVKCFVEDCGYTSVWDEFSQELKKRFDLPAFPLLNSTSLLCKIKYGWTFKEASPLDQVKKCHLPMFFIHGNADTYVPTWMVYPLYEAKSAPKNLWIVPGAEHAKSYKQNPKMYLAKVKAFTDSYIN